MSKKGGRYPKPNILNQKRKQIKSQQARPTEPLPLSEESEIQVASEYQEISKRPVPVKESGWEKVANILKEWGALFAVVTVIAGFAIWASSLQFNVAHSKEKLERHEKKIEENGKKLATIEIQNAGMFKEVEHLTTQQKKIDRDIESVRKVLSEK